MAKEQESGNTPMILGVAAAVLAAGAFLWFFVLGSGEGHVTGTVTLDDVPLPGAQVVFIGEDEKNRAPLVTLSDEKGEYRLVGNQGPGIPAGKYKVTVTKMALPNGTVPVGERLEQARSKGLLKNFVPKKYEDLSTTPLIFDIRAGSNRVDLTLTKQP